MKRKYNLRKIKSKRSYTSEELAETLKVHVQTIHDWKKKGLLPLEENTSPHLFLGSEIKNFLTKFAAKHKVKLKEGEFYCLSCRKAVKPARFKIVNRGIKIGHNKESLILKAKCPLCSKTINKFSSRLPVKKKEKHSISIMKYPDKNLEKDAISLFNQEIN